MARTVVPQVRTRASSRSPRRAMAQILARPRLRLALVDAADELPSQSGRSPGDDSDSCHGVPFPRGRVRPYVAAAGGLAATPRRANGVEAVHIVAFNCSFSHNSVYKFATEKYNSNVLDPLPGPRAQEDPPISSRARHAPGLAGAMAAVWSYSLEELQMAANRRPHRAIALGLFPAASVSPVPPPGRRDASLRRRARYRPRERPALRGGRHSRRGRLRPRRALLRPRRRPVRSGRPGSRGRDVHPARAGACPDAADAARTGFFSRIDAEPEAAVPASSPAATARMTACRPSSAPRTPCPRRRRGPRSTRS